MYKIRHSQPNLDLKDIKAATQSLKSIDISNGPNQDNLEKYFKKKFKLLNCLAVSNASNGLILALKAHNFKKGDIVWTSSVTFCSNVNSGLHLDGRVVLLDTDVNFPNLNFNDIEKKLKNTKKNFLPKFIILTYIAGFTIDLSKALRLKKKYKFKLIEDASHCIGAKYKDKNYVGSKKYIDASVFSTHAVKIITSGEGGILSIHKDKEFNKAKLLRSHGIIKNKKIKINNIQNSKLYSVNNLGYNFRITDFQCAILISQLKKLKKFHNIKKKICQYYIKLLPKEIFEIPNVYNKEINESSLHLFIVYMKNKYINKRDNLIAYLDKNKIETNIHYIPNHLHKYYNKKNNVIYEKKNMINSENYFYKCLTLPLHTKLKKKDLNLIIKHIKKFFYD